MRKVYLLLISLLLLFGLTACGGATEIEINSYVEVSFTGYDTLGQIEEYDFDARKMLSDYEKVLEDASKKEVEKLLLQAIKFKNDTELKNGDEVTVTWDIDEDDLAEFEEEYKVKLIFSDFEVEVDGLEKMDSFDPFEDVYVYFDGYAPCGSAYLDVLYVSSSGMNRYDFSYKLDKKENLSNGDVVTVTVSAYGEDDFVDFCVKEYGKIPSALTKEFTVSGLPTYVTDVKEIPAEDLSALDQYIQNVLKEKTADWVNPDSFYGMTLMGNVFAQKTYQDYYSYVENKLYFIYKVDVDTVQDGAFAYYYYGSLSNLKMDENGKLIYSENDISVPEKYGSWYASGTYFTKSDLYYEGYETYDALYAAEIEPLTKNYDTVVNNVNKDIITKVTHEPNDYSKVTDTLELSADSFTYKWYQGSYLVSGLTESAYQKIMEYTVADYVSIKLPAATTDGSVVEGFYSSYDEGGYAFSELVCDEAPRFELVCADTYTIFYGFCDDKRFNSSNLYKMMDIKLNAGIKEFKARAFQNCTSIESITLPEGMETIPEYLFAYCTGLKEVIIPSTVTEIQRNAFYGCTSLVIDSLEIGSMKIGFDAFFDVTIKKVTLSDDSYVPQREYSWGSLYASMHGAKIEELVIAEGVTQIPDYAFEGVLGFTSLTIPGTVTKIGVGAFAENKTLETLTLNAGLEIIKADAFKGCTAMKNANIPSTVTLLESGAFGFCSSLFIDSLDISSTKVCVNVFEQVTIGEVILGGDEYTLEHDTGWGSVYAPFNAAFIKKLTIKDGVTKIPDYAFEYADGFTEVVIPSTVTVIGERAFANCDDLKTVTLSEGIELISWEAFRDCLALKSVNIPNSLKTLHENVFYNCTALSFDYLDFTSMAIHASAFYGVVLQEIVLSADGYVSQRYEQWSTVYGPWTGAIVKKITIKEGVTQIPDYAFEDCEGVTEVVLPSTITLIGTNAFYDSSTLRTVTLNEGVEKIGFCAFKLCANLKTINIPSTVTMIDADAFHSCSSLLLDKLDISGITIGTYAFYLATINEVVLDSNEFGTLRFVNWSTLYSPWSGSVVKKITITDNVTEIPAFVFEDIDTVDKVVVPATVTKIGECAFNHTNFKEVHIPASVTTLDWNVFSNCNADTLLVVTPAGSAAESYATSAGFQVKNH